MDAMKDALRKKRMDGMAVTILIGKPGEEGQQVASQSMQQESDLAPDGDQSLDIAADPMESKPLEVPQIGAEVMEEKPAYGSGAVGLRKRMQDAVALKDKKKV